MFANKVILITGASSGIGAEIAVHFAKKAAKLALVGRNANNLAKVASVCKEISSFQPLEIVGDISKEDDVHRIIDDSVRKYSRLDVLINNAGTSKLGGIKTLSLAEYDEVMAVNVRGTFHLTSLAVPHLIKSKGCIVNSSSARSIRPHPAATVYCMSKAAIDNFTKSLALDLGPDGVRVNSVNAGHVQTNFLDKMNVSEEKQKIIIENHLSTLPLRRLVETGDVASLVAFLVSDEAKNITGCCYPIDSGNLLL